MIYEQTILHPPRVPLAEKVAFLRRSETYAGARPVQAIETHMSWVFLTGRYAYKLKKPVRYDFLDFGTSEARHAYCLEEVRLNRPLAGDTYCGVVPLTADETGMLTLNGHGRAVDWLVQSRRLPQEHMLAAVIRGGQVRHEWVQLAAEKMAGFYIASPPATTDAARCRQQLMGDIEINSDGLLNRVFGLPHTEIIRVATDLLHFMVKYADLFDRRVAEGRVVEGHGDLRPEHICVAIPVVIDRLEFDPALRVLDIAEELAFLAMECEAMGTPATGQLFLNVYEWKSGDRIPPSLLTFYKAKRALLRARLSALHLLENAYRGERDTWTRRCRAYLSMAGKYVGRLSEIHVNG